MDAKPDPVAAVLAVTLANVDSLPGPDDHADSDAAYLDGFSDALADRGPDPNYDADLNATAYAVGYARGLSYTGRHPASDVQPPGPPGLAPEV